MIVSENNENGRNAGSANFVALTEPNQTKNQFQMLSQRVDDTIVSGLKKTISALEKELANALDGLKCPSTQL